MKKPPKGRLAYRMAAQGGTARIDIYEDIVDPFVEEFFGFGVSAKSFAEDLAGLGPVSTIDVHINSYGGVVFDGTAIYNSLKAHDAEVHVHVDGIAASIASVIAMAGDRITMAANAYMMIHRASGMAFGNADDLRDIAGTLDKVDGTIAQVYADRSGSPRKQVGQWMDAETWFTADEALAAGLADGVSANVKVTAAMDRLRLSARFKNAPAEALEPARLGCEMGPDGECLPALEDEAAPGACACGGNGVQAQVDPPRGVPLDTAELQAAGTGEEDDETEDGAPVERGDPHQARALKLRQERLRRRRGLARTG